MAANSATTTLRFRPRGSEATEKATAFSLGILMALAAPATRATTCGQSQNQIRMPHSETAPYHSQKLLKMIIPSPIIVASCRPVIAAPQTTSATPSPNNRFDPEHRRPAHACGHLWFCC
jgi:hypothetical protein